jgi:hypothetical protein
MKSHHTAPQRLKHKVSTGIAGFHAITAGGLSRGRSRRRALRGADAAVAGDESSSS